MTEPLWWQTGVIYQVYPRSFADANGDGIGDLAGITARLDYLVDLGVDAVWLSPIFPSPMADFGYDVADYCGVDPRFGTLADFDALRDAAHARGLKLLLDFVPNHSSSEHPWFLESRSSRTNPKRDWYIWRDPAPDGGPPNNWQSYFGGSAWEWDKGTGQYYLHQFLKEQPELNWRNPELRAAMLDAMRFWFDRGVDGFRIDVLWLAIKHPAFPDNPANPDWREGMQDIERLLPVHSADQPEMMGIIAAMREVADAYPERVLIGEIYLPIPRLVAYYGEGGNGVHLPFNFHLLDARWDAASLAQLIAHYEGALPADGWPNWVLGNHDKPRVASRVGPEQAPVAMMLLLTLRGTPTLYQGDELGMPNVPIPPERVQDPQALREPDTAFNRDEVRTPMPWDASAHAGFSTVEPWLPLNPDWAERNVMAQRDMAGSMLAFTRALLELRRAHRALSVGSWHAVSSDGAVLAYERRHGADRVLVALNLSDTPQTLRLPAWAETLTPVLTTPPTRHSRLRGDDGGIADGAVLSLAPNQGIILA